MVLTIAFASFATLPLLKPACVKGGKCCCGVLGYRWVRELRRSYFKLRCELCSAGRIIPARAVKLLVAYSYPTVFFHSKLNSCPSSIDPINSQVPWTSGFPLSFIPPISSFLFTSPLRLRILNSRPQRSPFGKLGARPTNYATVQLEPIMCVACIQGHRCMAWQVPPRGLVEWGVTCMHGDNVMHRRLNLWLQYEYNTAR